MTNPLARFAGQFEISLADLARRVAASVVDPIKAKGQEAVSGIVGVATSAIKGLVIRLLFALVAAAMAVVAIVFAVAALYWALLPHLGPVETRLVLAGLFVILAIVCAVGMMFWPVGSTDGATSATASLAAAQEDAKRAYAHAVAATAPSPAASQHDDSPAGHPAAMDLRSGVEVLATILGEAGFRREQAGLRTGIALAGQLKPMQIASLALIGGYVAGLRYRARRRRR